MQGTYRSGGKGEGGKHLLCDPGSELRLLIGMREKEVKIVNGMNKQKIRGGHLT